MSISDILQWVAVGAIVGIAVVYLVRRLRSDARGDGCGSCELKDNCNKKKNNKNF
ncbi:MAG: hypothetical protein K2O00_08755 [Muribaculaceae bacterium]|nr:hypothetical protein [Muribaculaceae bacterium]